MNLKALLATLLLALATCVAGAQTRLAVPSYQDPGSPEWNAWAAVGPSSVGIMIVNEDNGDDTSNQPAIAEAIRAARAQGIFVVGYVYTGYGQRDPAIVRNRIDAVYKNYLVDGIFFDEAPTDCLAANPHGGTNYSYYQQLGEYIRTRQAGGRLVIMNPGTQPPNDCWMSIASILVTAESSSLSDYLTDYVDQPWFRKYAPSRFWHIVYNAPGKDQLQQILTLSQQRGAGWLYVTDLGSDNPYAGPPTYWKTEAAAVAHQELQSLYATARPRSSDEAGKRVPARVSFRWQSRNATHWEILLSNTPESPLPEERIDVDINGKVHVFSRAGDWHEVDAHAAAFTLENNTHLVELDARGLPATVSYQIRAVDGRGETLAITAPIPLSLTNTDYIFDIENH